MTHVALQSPSQSKTNLMTLSSGFERRLALPGESLVQGGQGAGGHGCHQALHLEGGPGGKVTKTKMLKKTKKTPKVAY